jgi:hypothetical protein
MYLAFDDMCISRRNDKNKQLTQARINRKKNLNGSVNSEGHIKK